MREDPGGYRDETLKILHEDEQLLVCVKPGGVLSAADASGKKNMQTLLAPRQTFPVHRLDREACGLMVFAKTKEAAAFLSGQMGTGFEKEYLAVCQGEPPEAGELTDLLYHDKGKNKTYTVKRKRAGVREAKLSYIVTERKNGCSLLKIRLFTGRTHQIRVQFASRGFPLVGDRKYGAKSGGTLQLCSVKLSVPHPTGGRMSFELEDAPISLL